MPLTLWDLLLFSLLRLLTNLKGLEALKQSRSIGTKLVNAAMPADWNGVTKPAAAVQT